MRSPELAVLLLLVAGGCAEPPPFTIVALPDTQCYALNFPEVFLTQGQWIDAVAEARDVRAVIHLGDVTENNDPAQWAVAADAVGPLYDRMAIALAPGNHDLGPNGSALDRTTMIDAAFPMERIRVAPGFLESFEDRPENTAWLVEGAMHDFVLVALEFAPRAAVLDWARGVFEAYPDAIGVLSTHAYLDGEGRRYDRTSPVEQPFCPSTYGVANVDASDGEEIFRGVVAPAGNVRLVLSGHVPNGFAVSADVNDAGDEVVQVMADYQTGTRCPTEGGDGQGFLLDMQVSERPAGVDVRIRSHSPWLRLLRRDHGVAVAIDLR